MKVVAVLVALVATVSAFAPAPGAFVSLIILA